MPKTKPSYSDLLKDQRWQKKRLELLDASGWKCQSSDCQNESDKPPLHVHHRIYQRGFMPWEYEDWAYQVLCDECHASEQAIMQNAYTALARHPQLMNTCAAISRMEEEIQGPMTELFLEISRRRPELRRLLPDVLNAVLWFQAQSYCEGVVRRQAEASK